MAIVNKIFSITTDSGTRFFREGQQVDDTIAKKYPHFMAGYKGEENAHNPNLPAKLTKKQIAGMGEEDLMQWLRQYRPAALPTEKVDKAALAEIVLDQQG